MYLLPFVYLLWRNVHQILCPFLIWAVWFFLFLSFRVSLYILYFNCVSDIWSADFFFFCKYFLLFCALYYHSLDDILGDGLVTKLCLTRATPMDCSPPDSSVHEIFQARILKWVAISFSRRSSQSKDWTQVFWTAGRLFTDWSYSLVAFNFSVKNSLLHFL